MSTMKTRTTDFVNAINHLPDGATVIFYDVSWEQYEELLEDFRERPHFRISYDGGTLEVMSPLQDHEEYARFIDRLIQVISEELGRDIQSYGSATWRRQERAKGVEPDCCFYIQNANRVIGKRTIDLESDPPPDIVVDTTNRSIRKFPVYAALEVPEIWQYDGRVVRFYILSEGTYGLVSESVSIHKLKPEWLTTALEQSKTVGQSAALLTFRGSFR